MLAHAFAQIALERLTSPENEISRMTRVGVSS
jgi:hypothetical protein